MSGKLNVAFSRPSYTSRRQKEEEDIARAVQASVGNLSFDCLFTCHK